MRFFDRFSRGELPLTRVEAFSDGVFAIVVTLLALELKIPALHEPASVGELARGLLDLLPKFLSWMISFVIVGKFWLNHHHILRFARHANYGMVWLNSIFLMFQTLIPFPTALMGEYPANPLAVGLFGIVMTLNTLLFMTLQAYILRNLIKPGMAGTRDPHVIRKGFVGPLSYLLGVAAALFSIPLAFAIYMLTPLFYIVPPPDAPAPVREKK